MKTAVSIPDDLFEAAEKVAAKLSISRSELYCTAVREYLEARCANNVTEKLNEVYADESSELDEGLVEMQLRSLPEDSW